jgi:hypothetical protein
VLRNIRNSNERGCCGLAPLSMYAAFAAEEKLSSRTLNIQDQSRELIGSTWFEGRRLAA